MFGNHGVLEHGMVYIRKPLTPSILAFKMQEILNQTQQYPSTTGPK